MHPQDHISGVVSDDGFGLSGGIVEELVDFYHCVLCGYGLLCCKGPECSEHRQIDGACIVEENADDLLDFIFVRLGEGGGRLPLWCISPFVNMRI